MTVVQLKPKKPVSAEEQETTIIIDSGAVAHVYSCNPKTLKEFQQWLQDYPELVNIHADDDYGTHITVPKKWIKIKPPKRMSDEWRANAEKRLQQTRANKKSAKE